MSLIGLLILVLICCAVVWVTSKLLIAFSVPEPIATVLFVTVVMVLLIALVHQFGYGVPLRL